jgi:hypothetical protein
MKSARHLGAVSRPLLVALAVVVLVGVVAVVQSWMTPPTKPDAAVGQRVAEDFLTTLRAGNAGGAWDAATAEFKSIEGRESFIRTAARAPILKEQLHFASMQEVKVGDQPRAEYIFQSPAGKIARVLVGYEGGAWKVDRLTL